MRQGCVVWPEGNRGILLTDCRPDRLHRPHSACPGNRFLFISISPLCFCYVLHSLNLQPSPAPSLPAELHVCPPPCLTNLSNSTFQDVCWLLHGWDSQAFCCCHLAFESCARVGQRCLPFSSNCRVLTWKIHQKITQGSHVPWGQRLILHIFIFLIPYKINLWMGLPVYIKWNKCESLFYQNRHFFLDTGCVTFHIFHFYTFQNL